MLRRLNQRWILFCTLAISISSCGLSDYEQRMEQTQARLANLDRERQLLTAQSLQYPELPNLFLRVPKGISLQPHQETSYPEEKFHHFPLENFANVVTAIAVYISSENNAEQGPKATEQLLMKRFYNYLTKQAKYFVNNNELLTFGEVTTKREAPYLKVQRFQAYQLPRVEQYPTGASQQLIKQLPKKCIYRYDIYFYHNKQLTIMIIYQLFDRNETAKFWDDIPMLQNYLEQLPKADLKQLRELVQMSLATLELK